MYDKVPAPAAALLDFLAKFESNGNYNAYFGHSGNDKPITGPLDAVIAWQHRLVAAGARSSAVGRYQFMSNTLKWLMEQYNIPGDTNFTPDLQDELGYYLLLRRGYERWIAGTISDSTFADQLSMEWASMPFHTGKSYYDSGLNHSLVSRAKFIAAIAGAKSAGKAPAAQVAKPEVAPTQENPMGGLLGSLASMIAGVVGKGQAVATVATVVPDIVTGAFKSVDEAKEGFAELTELVNDIKAGKFNEVADDFEKILGIFREIMVNFGIDHDGLNAATTKMASAPPVTTPPASA